LAALANIQSVTEANNTAIAAAVVQQDLRTPTELSFANCCTRGIHGLVFGSAFMQLKVKGHAGSLLDSNHHALNLAEAHFVAPAIVKLPPSCQL
jgi:hypothetical protein